MKLGKNEGMDEVKKVESTVVEVEDAAPKKEKKPLSKKQKGIIIAVVAVILIIALGIGGYFIYQDFRKIDLIATEKSVEYGETYTPNIADFVNESKINDSYSINGEMPNEEGKDYPAIGDYSFTISAKNKDDVAVTVKVEDTTEPVFDVNAPSEISTFKDVAITEDNLKNTFAVTDLSTVALTIDDVDYATVGEYTVNLYATDESGNVANKGIKVIVNEPTITLEQANISVAVGETAQLNATVQGASQTITWTSSDESVATVDANGVVTGIKKGTATVNAEANGTKTSVTVTVTSVNNSSSNSNTNSSSSQGKKAGNSNKTTSSGTANSGNNGTSNNSSTSTGQHSHSPSIGTIGKWFDSRTELEMYVTSIINDWKQKLANQEITLEEYSKNAPTGYEAWSCATCGKWTGNFKYR